MDYSSTGFYVFLKRLFFHGSLMASAAYGQVPDGRYTIQSVHSGLCMDVTGASKDNGAPLQQYTCNGTDAQLFEFKQKNGAYRIANVASGLVMEVGFASREDGAAVLQWLDAADASQRFNLVPYAEDQFTIRALHTGKCLDVRDFSLSSAASIQQWACFQGQANQLWKLVNEEGETPTQPLPPTPPSPPLHSGIRTDGRQLLVHGKPFVMKAVCWNPVKKGWSHPEGLLFFNPSTQDLVAIEEDFRLMRELGVNTLRSYDAILDPRVLNLVEKYGLHLIVPVMNYHATSFDQVRKIVKTLKDHPSTLFWEIGNEWNYNHFYSNGAAHQDLGYVGSKERVKQVAQLIRSLDTRLPISTVYGELPDKALIEELREIDMWGLNIYSGLTFGDRFERWKSLSNKPMYLAEYGADAMNIDRVDLGEHARAVAELTKEIQANLSATHQHRTAIGGSLFEWNDEWWKSPGGRLDQQDNGGFAPGGGPHPDRMFNEEWWGLVDIDRNPRPAFIELKKLWK